MVTKMSEHNFAFIVSGVDAHADDFADRFYEAGCDDATLMLVNSLVAVCFAREAENYTHAVVSAYHNVLSTGAKVERFEPDFLVSKAEIAKRANLTRAAVTNYVNGERGMDFPAPHARITSASPLWDWVEVSGWLHKNDLLPVEEVVNARISRTINWVVQNIGRVVPDTEKNFARLLEGVAKEPLFA
jgi:hypothetical protein